jgi:hypothetical protein
VYGVPDAVPVIVTVQLKVPAPVTMAPHDPIVAPAPIVVVIVLVGVNPVPETPTETPLGPWDRVSVIPGVVIVNEAVALSEPPSDPVAVTVYGVPDAAPVTVTVQLNAPVAATVAPHAVIVAPTAIVVVTTALGANPAPTTPTDTPVGPWVGERVIPGVVIV